MVARSPGKLVISGAYSVLEGAPAIVAAVDRYVVADASRPAEMVTEEVKTAMALGMLDSPPWFDASALRISAPDGSSRKLGLGSSAAILVASLLACWRSTPMDESHLDLLFKSALVAHRQAQGGGSGIDVAASVYGGVLWCQSDNEDLSVRPHRLPMDLVIEVFVSQKAAQTRLMLEAVQRFAAEAPDHYRVLIQAASDAAKAAVSAKDTPSLLSALREQTITLAQLGDCAEVPIVTADVRRLGAEAKKESAVFLPSGAGGGDIAIFVGTAPSSEAFGRIASSAGLERHSMAIGAKGVHCLVES